MDEEKTKEEPEEKESSGEGEVKITEEFQKKVTALIEEYADSDACLDFMCDECNSARDALRKKEMEKDSKGKSKSPNAFSTESMPD